MYGTTQNVQYFEQPSMIETNAVGPSARGSGRRSNFSISGKRDVDLRLAGRAARFDHLGQAMQRLRAEHEIDIRRALDDRLAFLARDAAADADHDGLVVLLQLPSSGRAG